MARIDDLTLEQIKTLDVEAQIEAMNSLWANIAATEPELPVSEAEKKILDKAIEEFDPKRTRSWESIKSELKTRIR